MKILCIPYCHALSHLSRPLAVAAELKTRGHEIVFAGESGNIDFIRKQGHPVRPLYEPDPTRLFANIRSGKLRFTSGEDIRKMIRADLKLFQDVKPDIVLTDGRFSALISTHSAGVKHAAIVNVSSTEYRANPYVPFFDWLPFRRSDGAIWRTLDSVNLALEMAVFNNVCGFFKRLSSEYGLQKQATAGNCLTGKDATLLADIPEYFPARNLPADYAYVGPLTWKSSLPPPAWWPPVKSGKPLIYVTMGSTGLKHFVPMAAELFEKSGDIAVITTGSTAGAPPRGSGTVHIEPFIDGDMAAEECAVVVCHGGNGTIYQALRHGKPVIGIPTLPDQAFNMRRVEALGAGRSLSWRSFTKRPSSLSDLVREVLDSGSYSKNAASLKTVIASLDPAGRAADIIERL